MPMSRSQPPATISAAGSLADELRPLFRRFAAACLLGTAMVLAAAMLVFDLRGGRTLMGGALFLLLSGSAVALGFTWMTADARFVLRQIAAGLHGPRNAPSDDDEESFPRLFAKQIQIFDTLAGDCGRLLTNDLVVRDLMTTDVTTALPETPVERLAVTMRELDVHHLIICGPDRQVLGVVSDRDVMSCAGKKAQDIMTSAPLTLPSDAMVRTAMSYLIDRRISSLPIVDEGKLVGIFTTTDALMGFQCTMQVVRAAAANLVPKSGATAAATLPFMLSP
jgi:CBS domain-containing protein